MLNILLNTEQVITRIVMAWLLTINLLLKSAESVTIFYIKLQGCLQLVFCGQILFCAGAINVITCSVNTLHPTQLQLQAYMATCPKKHLAHTIVWQLSVLAYKLRAKFLARQLTTQTESDGISQCSLSYEYSTLICCSQLQNYRWILMEKYSYRKGFDLVMAGSSSMLP